jgi:formate--tetrahydrofolate ligase
MSKGPQPSDLEIARSVKPRPIAEVAAKLGLGPESIHGFGSDKAKVDLGVLDRPRTRPGEPKLVLVSAITPTPAGEGKTTTSIGLAQALAKLGASVCVALRQPSLGPCFGMKGGATGGGYSQLTPADSINLHFTGDFHAIGTAHNLLAALADNHIHFDNVLRIDPRRFFWKRVIDMNDRSLRHIVAGLGGPAHGIPRETGFDITASSEVMAILCLSKDYADLRARLDRIIVALDANGDPVTAGGLKATGAMMALLKDALLPNLVQTLEGVPALVHGGPFANIAHGCSSVIATKTAMKLADWTVTEAGFGFDLGAEKFYDIKCRSAGLDTAAVVLVATVRALKLHGGHSVAALKTPDPVAVAAGLPNLEKHIENIRTFGEVPVVALNRFGDDTEEEISVIRRFVEERGVPFAICEHHARGGEGAVDLARTVMTHAEKTSRPFSPLYALEDSVPDKILAVAHKMYGARSVIFAKGAQKDLEDVRRLGADRLPVCIAKTQSSLSDDPTRLGRPRDFDVTVQSVQVNAGAGFLVVITGEILRMPGLPRKPHAESVDFDGERIIGVK